jgi:hypothetical protein
MKIDVIVFSVNRIKGKSSLAFYINIYSFERTRKATDFALNFQ